MGALTNQQYGSWGQNQHPPNDLDSQFLESRGLILCQIMAGDFSSGFIFCVEPCAILFMTMWLGYVSLWQIDVQWPWNWIAENRGHSSRNANGRPMELRTRRRNRVSPRPTGTGTLLERFSETFQNQQVTKQNGWNNYRNWWQLGTVSQRFWAVLVGRTISNCRLHR